jgi:DNA-binding transcriptional ArsR family regulator
MATSTDDRLSVTFSALAHPVRRSMLERLSHGEATVNELAEPFAMSLPAISRHIKVLEHAGLVTQGQRAQYRPCAIDAAPLREIASWAEQYRPIWEGRFDQLASYLHELDGTPAATDHTTDDQKDDE